MELIVCSEMSTHKIQTPGNHPKDRIQQSSVSLLFIVRSAQQCGVKLSYATINKALLSYNLTLHHIVVYDGQEITNCYIGTTGWKPHNLVSYLFQVHLI